MGLGGGNARIAGVVRGFGFVMKGRWVAMMRLRSIMIVAAAVCLAGFGAVERCYGGTVVGWGSNAGGLQDDIPEGTNFVAVDAGSAHSVALRSDGTVAAWGSNSKGQLNVPDSNEIAAISAGYEYNLALKKNGSIVGWGSNSDNQVSSIPAGTGFKAIAAGAYHGLAVRANGTVAGWGYNFLGQATAPAGNNYIAIAAGTFHSVGIRGEGGKGTISSWGTSSYGLLNSPAGSDFTAVAAGAYHSIALRENGTIATWGIRDGSVGKDYGQVTGAPTDGGYVAIAAGEFFSVALKDDGSLVAWGRSDSGQLNVPAGNSYVAINAGSGHGVAISEPGKLMLIAPNGGEILKTGSFFDILWDTEGSVSDVKIEYSADNGATWKSVADVANTGGYEWMVPAAGSQECLVRVATGLGSYGSDVSDAVLTIYRCELAGDVTGDCAVNLADVAVIASEWLMDAYPFKPDPLSKVDFNGDNTVDVKDLSIFGGWWLSVGCNGPDWCEGTDVNESHAVDFRDFAEMSKYWRLSMNL
jgi:hypothetical protein